MVVASPSYCGGSGAGQNTRTDGAISSSGWGQGGRPIKRKGLGGVGSYGAVGVRGRIDLLSDLAPVEAVL